MDTSKNSSFRPSGIPRFSRLPIPRGPHNPLVPETRKTAHALKRPVAHAKPAENVPQTQGSDTKDKRISDTVRQWEVSERQGSLELLDADQIRPQLMEDKSRQEPPLNTRARGPRPSLSDRAIETLSQIPPSPSVRRRKSSFFPSEDLVASTSRPASSLARSRPSTSHGQHPPLPTGFPTPRPFSPDKRQLAPTTGNPMPQKTPSKRSVSSVVPRSLPNARRKIENVIDFTPSKSKPTLPSLHGQINNTDTVKPGQNTVSRQMRGSKTLAAKPSRPRVSVREAFEGPPSREHMDSETGNAGSTTARSQTTTPPKSSVALRETIAKAKAARRNAAKSQTKQPNKVPEELQDFPNIVFGGNNKGLLRKRIAMARSDGRLNIAAMGLKEMPTEVMNMYNLESFDTSDGAWYESVDLVKLVAADNEFEQFDDSIFPDDPAGGLDERDDDYQGNLFGGIESLDLHGNHLRNLPSGLRRLERLTILNLSKNKLTNDNLDVLGFIESLRELRLADNALGGMIYPSICNLQKLEILDLSNNAITALPDHLSDLGALHTIIVAGNRLASLPFEKFASMALNELDASRNRLSGSLIAKFDGHFTALKSLDLSNNALTSITGGEPLAMPSLQYLSIAENRVESLPSLLNCTGLITLSAVGNKLSSIPESLLSLRSLQNVDFSRNDIRKIDERIGLMENLTVFNVANNPLRERRFWSMNTDDLKRELQGRLSLMSDSEEVKGGTAAYDAKLDGVPEESAASSKRWPVKPGGILDRSSTNLVKLETAELQGLVQTSDIKVLILHHNLFTHVPPAISLTASTLTTLDLSHNKVTSSACLPNPLSLPALKTLDLSSNALTSLFSLLENLFSPLLTELNVSRNRLTTLPALRSTFPALSTLLASDNSINELTVEAAQGLYVLDVSGNEISFLEPRLGLLGGGEGNLRTLVVGGNTFRVPRRDVVEKGTEAILTWLRGRIPEDGL